MQENLKPTLQLHIEGGLSVEQQQVAAELKLDVHEAQQGTEFSAVEADDVNWMLESDSIVMVARGILRHSRESGGITFARHRFNKAMRAARNHYMRYQDEYYTTAAVEDKSRSKAKSIQIKTGSD